jgi:hypothetical protein
MYLQLAGLILKKSELVSIETIWYGRKEYTLKLTTKQSRDYSITNEDDIKILLEFFSSRVS